MEYSLNVPFPDPPRPRLEKVRKEHFVKVFPVHSLYLGEKVEPRVYTLLSDARARKSRPFVLRGIREDIGDGDC